jgi:hypothetical protein
MCVCMVRPVGFVTLVNRIYVTYLAISIIYETTAESGTHICANE